MAFIGTGTLTLGLAHRSVRLVPSTALKEGTGGRKKREPREKSESPETVTCSHTGHQFKPVYYLLVVIIPPWVFSDPFISHAFFKVLSIDHFH